MFVCLPFDLFSCAFMDVVIIVYIVLGDIVEAAGGNYTKMAVKEIIILFP